MTLYERVMAIKTPEREEISVKDYLDAREDLIRTEITQVGDRLTAAVVGLEGRLETRLESIDDDLKDRATKSNVRWAGALSAGSVLLGIVAVLAFVFQAFDAGASMTASFSDDVLEAKGAHRIQAEQIKAMDAKYEQIDNKLDALILASTQSAGAAYRDVPEPQKGLGARTDKPRP